jgi:hypothetical protein
VIGDTLVFKFYPLQACGLKALLLIKFDIMAGPYIAFEGLCADSKVAESLKDPIILAQFHMGLAETDVDVIEKQGERMVIARRKRMIEGIEAKDILVVLIEDEVASNEAKKLADELLGRTGGDLAYLRNELRKLCDAPQHLTDRLKVARLPPSVIKKADLMKEAGTKIPIMAPEDKDKVLKGDIASQLVNEFPMDLITSLVHGVNNKLTILSLWKLYSPVNTDLLVVYELFTSLNTLEVCHFEENRSFFTARL